MDEEGTFEEGTAESDTPEVESSTDVAPAAAIPARKPRRIVRRILGWGAWGIAALAVLAILFVSGSERGQRIVLDELLERIGGALAGELKVDGIRSTSLVFGFTLQGVRLDAEGGRRFLEADSAVVRYWPLSLAFGSPRLRSTTFFGLEAEISRYPGDDFANVNRIVPTRSPDDTVTASPQTIGLGRVAVRGGNLEILVPASGGAEELTVPGPGGARLRRMAVQNLDLDLEQTVFRSVGPVMVDARLASFSASVLVLNEPLVVREAQGDLSFGDRGLRIQAGEFRLPGSFVEGGLGFGPDRAGDPWRFTAEIGAEEWADLADIGWVNPLVPSGRFRGVAAVRVADAIEVRLQGVEVETGGTSIVLDGGTSLGDSMILEDLRLTASPLLLSSVEPWLEQALPFAGSLRGSATLAGTMQDLAATGRMTFTPRDLPSAATTADFSGTLHLGSNPGGTELDVRLDPFDYRVLEPLWPDARLLGRGRATLSIEGRAQNGLMVVADVTHRSDATTTSRVVGRGLVRRGPDEAWIVDLRGELAPLSLPLLGRLWPAIDLPGAVRGPLQVAGRLTDLRVTGDLTSDAGRVVFDASADMTAPAAGYRIEADAEELDISAFTTSVPSPSVFSGHVDVDGAGLTLESFAASIGLALRSARVGALAIDSADAVLRVEDGVITADTMRASMAGVLLDGAGSIGMFAEREGTSRFAFSAESLEGLRPVFMGDSILVGDTLNPLEQDALRARGIDPDTLPTAMDVRMQGAVRGTADVRGWFRDMSADLVFDLLGGAYGYNSVDSAHVALSASGLPEIRGTWDADVDARGIVWADREFEQVHFDGTMLQRRGEGTLDVVRGANESYFLTGAFAVDSLGGELQLTDAIINVIDQSWVLSRPTTMVWNESSLTVDSLEVRRSDDDPMLLTAAGTLARGGDSNFRLMMEGFHIEQALQVAQREDIDLSGHIDLDLNIVGPAERPLIDVRFHIEDPEYGVFQLARLDGSLEYENRSATFEVAAWDDERQVLTGEGVMPVNLTLTEVEDRAVEATMDVMVRADSLDAALALVYLSALEDVVGTVSAVMHVGGTPSRPEPSGTVTLTNAAWTVDALGVRHTGVSGELLLQPNRTVAIKLATAGSGGVDGSSTISGIVRLEPALTNPTLDLAIGFDRFLAVDRRDMRTTLSGDLTLTGTYQLPVTAGTLRMEEATLFVDEFARNVGVVDLRSPLLYAPGIAVDTTVFISQPLIAGLSNPFLDNLRVDVDMAVPRNLWLRSSEMNVEMGGDLIVRYDRGLGDLVLVGELQALRGSYNVLGRTFEVDGGTASFLGQPGVNPTLDIQALSRIRRREGGRLEVRATVQGTLVEPLVTLSTEEAGLSQSDLISYLLIGGPSGGATGGFGANLTTGVTTVATGALVNQLGTVLAQEIPFANRLDYLSFSQSDAFGSDGVSSLGTYGGNVFAGTQVELGKYLNDDVFVIFVLGGQNAAGGDGAGASVTFRGVRMELALAEDVFLEAFWEDQFIRSGTGGLGASGLEGNKLVGLLLFGEWGYGSQQQDEEQD
ncbi:MAG: translocation/assembly module TamB [Gemmatimonadota bacterium]|nr:translocation/assembly module TamB [Gemmatimonadota bacterium]